MAGYVIPRTLKKGKYMRFSDFFIEYKLKVLGISPYIKFRDMDKYKLIGLGISIFSITIGAILFVLKKGAFGYFYAVSVISMVITLLLAGRKKEKEKMLNNHYKPYSRKRMRAFSELLNDYGVNYKDEKKMSMLIEQADLAKERYSILKGIKSPINAVSTYIIIPIIISVLNRLIENIELNLLLTETIQWILLIFMLIGMWIAMSSMVKSMFGGDSAKYEDLKYDLQQMMIFGDMISSC